MSCQVRHSWLPLPSSDSAVILYLLQDDSSDPGEIHKKENVSVHLISSNNDPWRSSEKQ